MDFCFVLLFYKLKVCDNPVWGMFIDSIFPTAFAHFVSLCHILVILPIFQTLHQKKKKDYWLIEGSDNG